MCNMNNLDLWFSALQTRVANSPVGSFDWVSRGLTMLQKNKDSLVQRAASGERLDVPYLLLKRHAEDFLREVESAELNSRI